ncbi:MAG TPA: LysM peptidoglycan-binding domain-containing protein [Planctomycetota bacterium]|nr:LysM peptidoglycan-binding domain-containing protein [Planctomycetota bacterium]
MGNFEKLSVLVIVVIIVMILVVALYQWTGDPGSEATGGTDVVANTEPTGLGGGASLAPVNPLSNSVAQRPTPIGPAPFAAVRDPRDELTIKNLFEKVEATPTPVTTEPTVAPPAETPKPSEPRTHVVQPGETMGAIAKNYFPGRVQKGLVAMQAANPSVEAARMRVGTKLTIPDLGAQPDGAATPASTSAAPKAVASIERGGWYVTKRGDTLTSISKRAYGTTERWPEIWIDNMDALGTDFERPDPGVRIRIPR